MLLSHRGDPDVWYRSTVAMVLFRDLLADLDDRDEAITGYERWLDAVRAQITPERLVE